MKAVEILVAAKELISDESHWTRDSYAKDVYGSGQGAQSPDAVCWCSLGALFKIDGQPTDFYKTSKLVLSTEGTTAYKILDHAAFVCFDQSLVSVNDANTHKDVMTMFDKAISMAKENNERP